MLERKYGGVKARNAALTIQRAFRHYTLLKKFAAITAMAKAEKRLSRRMVGFTEETNENHSHRMPLDGYLPPGPPSMPLRSMSMRERRHTGVTNVPSSNTILPRSHSGRCDLNYFCDVPHTLYYAPQDIYMDISKVTFTLIQFYPILHTWSLQIPNVKRVKSVRTSSISVKRRRQ